jgi:uncharacterized protein YuzE
MNISYDETADAVYISLSDSIVERTIEVDPGTLVDVDRSGGLVGIEVIRPAKAWPLGAIARDYHLNDEDLQALQALWPNDRGRRLTLSPAALSRLPGSARSDVN